MSSNKYANPEEVPVGVMAEMLILQQKKVYLILFKIYEFIIFY